MRGLVHRGRRWMWMRLRASLGERLRTLGFSEDASEGAPVCRRVQRNAVLDVMPLDEKILGFSNQWYRAAMDSAVRQDLKAGFGRCTSRLPDA